MSKIISFSDLSKELEKELSVYSEEVTEEVKEIAKKNMEKLVKETRETAPVGRRKRHYKGNITSKKTGETTRGVVYTWYVKGPDYRLSHLLNDGHALRNGGRYKGTQFISKAVDKIIPEYEKEVEEAIKK